MAVVGCASVTLYNLIAMWPLGLAFMLTLQVCIPCRNCMRGTEKASILIAIDTILLLSYKLVPRDLQLGKGSY